MGLTKSINKLLKNNYVKIVIVSLLAWLFVRVLANYFLKEGFESKPDTFEKDIKEGKKLVWFYAEWCGHCKPMHSDWDKAAKKINEDGKNKMIKIDAGGKSPEQQKIAQKYQVDGFPTVSLYENGSKVEDYVGDRTEDAIVAFAKSKLN